MEVLTLPLPPSLRKKLLDSGFHTTNNLASVAPFHLAQEANITLEEAVAVLSLVPRASSDQIGGPFAGSTTAWDLLVKEKGRNRIGTGSVEVDKILGGGILSKELTEICGVPGVGKTQLSMQLAVNVQIPVKFGGVGGHAIYIDTEGSFMMERVLQITEAVIDSLRNKSPEFSAEPLIAEDFLSHMYLLRVHDPVEQLAVVNNLPTLLDQHKEVKLVIFDSITFNFRQDFEDMAGRTRLLANMAQKLMAVAEDYDVAIVLVNQVTHKVTREGSKTVPALEEILRKQDYLITRGSFLGFGTQGRVGLMYAPTGLWSTGWMVNGMPIWQSLHLYQLGQHHMRSLKKAFVMPMRVIKESGLMMYRPDRVGV